MMMSMSNSLSRRTANKMEIGSKTWSSCAAGKTSKLWLVPHTRSGTRRCPVYFRSLGGVPSSPRMPPRLFGNPLQLMLHSLLRELGDKFNLAVRLNNLGNVALMQGDHARARSLHVEGLALRLDLRDKWGIAVCLNPSWPNAVGKLQNKGTLPKECHRLKHK